MDNLSKYEEDKVKEIKCEYDKALYLVSCLFKNIKDKSGEPYINHLIRVSIGVEGKDTKVAALLHDVVEDIPGMSFNYLKELGFNDNVLEIVKIVTKDKRNKIPYHDEITRVLTSNNIEAIKLKYADMSDNYNSERLKLLEEETRIRLENKYKNEIIRIKAYLEEYYERN